MKPTVLIILALLALLHSVGCSKNSANPVAPRDAIPPGTISDLSVAVADSFSVTLGWSAPGGDGASGSAVAYEIRYGNTDVVSQTDWNAWTVVPSPPVPHTAATHESFKVAGLSSASQFVFAIRAKDGADNWSDESNTVLGRTTGFRTGPVLVVSTQDYPYGRYSENGGRTWKNMTVNDRYAKFGWLTTDPFDSSTLYATAPTLGQSLLGTAADRIWKSVDYGRTWDILSYNVVSSDRNLNGGGCRPVIVSPTAPGLLFESVTGVCDIYGNNCCGNCSGQLYKSTNGGATWTSIGNSLPVQLLPPYQNDQLPFPAFAVDPTNPLKMYVGSQYWCFPVSGGTSCYSPFLLSLDGGLNWTGPSTPLYEVNIYTIGLNPLAPTHLLLSSDHGIYFSENSGVNWTNVSLTTGPLAFTFDPSNAEVMYTPISKSIDGGQTWSAMPTPSGGHTEIGIDLSRHELYAVGTSGAYRSADGGATWSQVLAMGNCSSIAVLPDLPVPSSAVARVAGRRRGLLLAKLQE